MTTAPGELCSRYQAAERVLDATADTLVLNETITPRWSGSDGFWYRRQLKQGGEFIWITYSGARRRAFDHVAIAAVTAKLAGLDIEASALDVEEIAADGAVTLRAGGRRFIVNGSTGRELPVRAGAKPGEAIDPQGRWALFAHDHDLWLRDVATNQNRRLTDDGVEDYTWGEYPDWGFLAVVRRRSGLSFAPFGWSWSPDGAWLFGLRVNQRGVEPYPFVEHVPQDGSFRPRVYNIRQSLLGEPTSKLEAWAIEVSTGKKVRIDVSPDAPPFEPLAWAPDARRFFAIVMRSEGREIALVEIDVRTGEQRSIVIERPPGFINTNAELYNDANVRIIKNGTEAIWFSERSGWGHLYRYDCQTGALLNAVTSGEWLVRDILRIDEARERIFFTASGRENGNPYCRRLYRVNFDGGDLTLLTPEDADHTLNGAPMTLLARLYGLPAPPAMISPDGALFVDIYSTIDKPSVISLRSSEDGRVIAELERADASALFASGWTAPEPFVAKAADGETDLYGVIYRPPEGSALPAPVIDAIYGGPQLTVAPRNFRDTRRAVGAYGRAALAKLGFAVVVVDGRGTPLRSRAFHDEGFANHADLCLDDHVAVLKQLCARDSSLDGDRIGIYGHSAGGYSSARAIVRHPDVFKVAVASAGNHSYHTLYSGAAGFHPLPDYGDGLRVRPNARAVPENYRVLDNARYAENLRGKLLLAYGDMDENALPASTLLFYDVLIKANRSPDLLYLPNRTHSFAHEPYFVRRLWDYFVTHLLGTAPPQDYRIGGGADAGGFA